MGTREVGFYPSLEFRDGHSSGAMTNMKFVMTPPTNPEIIGSAFTAKSGWKSNVIKKRT